MTTSYSTSFIDCCPLAEFVNSMVMMNFHVLIYFVLEQACPIQKKKRDSRTQMYLLNEQRWGRGTQIWLSVDVALEYAQRDIWDHKLRNISIVYFLSYVGLQ